MYADIIHSEELQEFAKNTAINSNVAHKMVNLCVSFVHEINLLTKPNDVYGYFVQI